MNFPAGNARIFAAAALVGRGAEEISDTRVSEIRFQLTHLDRIFHTSPIGERTAQPSRSDSGEEEWSVTTRPSGLEWHDGSTRLAVTYMQSNTVFSSYEFGIRFTPVICISFDDPLDFMEAYDKWVKSMYRVMSVLTGKEEDVSYLEVKPAGVELARSPFLQVFANTVTQSPYMPERGRISRLSDSALRLDADQVSLLELIKEWNRLEEEQNPVVYTYEPYALGNEQHPRARFLLLIQALEGISNREARLNDRASSFARKRDRAINECMKFLTGANRKFVKNNLKKSPINLDDRLRDMLESLPVDLTEKIGSATLIKRLCSENNLKPESALRLVRNDLAHGNKTYDIYEIAEIAKTLQAVVRAHCLRILGLDLDIQRRALNLDEL